MYGLFFESQDGIVDVHVIGVKIHTHTHTLFGKLLGITVTIIFFLVDRSET